MAAVEQINVILNSLADNHGRRRVDRQTGCEKDVTAPNQTEGPVVVGMGASAGGLEAVQRFLKHMSPNSGMAFVLVQHLDPGHESILSDLLARNTKMPIEQI